MRSVTNCTAVLTQLAVTTAEVSYCFPSSLLTRYVHDGVGEVMCTSVLRFVTNSKGTNMD